MFWDPAIRGSVPGHWGVHADLAHVCHVFPISEILFLYVSCQILFFSYRCIPSCLLITKVTAFDSWYSHVSGLPSRDSEGMEDTRLFFLLFLEIIDKQVWGWQSNRLSTCVLYTRSERSGGWNQCCAFCHFLLPKSTFVVEERNIRQSYHWDPQLVWSMAKRDKRWQVMLKYALVPPGGHIAFLNHPLWLNLQAWKCRGNCGMLWAG